MSSSQVCLELNEENAAGAGVAIQNRVHETNSDTGKSTQKIADTNPNNV
ncbi:MAG: hypothetical protein ACXW1W_14920 [Methylococcaceae bacterium]